MRLWRAGNSDDPDDYDQADFWVNPAYDEADSPHATAEGLPDDALTFEIETLGMRIYSQEPEDAMLWDELRIGTTWQDVVGPTSGEVPLQAGDADRDFDFDQSDLVRVQIAGKYLTGQPATWGEGDWNGAPGGSQDSPPVGDGQFNQLDIIAALGAGTYLTGPYNAVRAEVRAANGPTSVGHGAGAEVLIPVPEPSTLLLAVLGLVAGLWMGRRATS
jgi:hypothetical protein